MLLPAKDAPVQRSAIIVAGCIWCTITRCQLMVDSIAPPFQRSVKPQARYARRCTTGALRGGIRPLRRLAAVAQMRYGVLAPAQRLELLLQVQQTP